LLIVLIVVLGFSKKVFENRLEICNLETKNEKSLGNELHFVPYSKDNKIMDFKFFFIKKGQWEKRIDRIVS